MHTNAKMVLLQKCILLSSFSLAQKKKYCITWKTILRHQPQLDYTIHPFTVCVRKFLECNSQSAFIGSSRSLRVFLAYRNLTKIHVKVQRFFFSYKSELRKDVHFSPQILWIPGVETSKRNARVSWGRYCPESSKISKPSEHLIVASQAICLRHQPISTPKNTSRSKKRNLKSPRPAFVYSCQRPQA